MRRWTEQSRATSAVVLADSREPGTRGSGHAVVVVAQKRRRYGALRKENSATARTHAHSRARTRSASAAAAAVDTTLKVSATSERAVCRCCCEISLLSISRNNVACYPHTLYTIPPYAGTCVPPHPPLIQTLLLVCGVC